jgi:hypothetical protein
MDKKAPPAPPKTEVGRSPGYIPRPPSKEDVEKVSEQQGLITDEWAPNSPPKPEGAG